MKEGTARAVTLLARYGLPAVVGLYYVAALQSIAYSPDGAYRGYLAAMDLRTGAFPILAGASTLAPPWVLLLAAADALGIDLLLGSKILSLVFCCFGLLGMYLFAATLIGDRITGLLATLVAAVDPWLLQAGPSGTSTGLALALSVGSLFFMVRCDFALGSFFAGLTAAVFWQGGVLMMLIVALITRSHGLSRASLGRVAGALAVFAAALVPWVIAAMLQGRSPVPEFLSGSEPLVIGAGRLAIVLSGAAAVVGAIVTPPVREDAAPFPVLSRVPYWGWVLWLLVCAWIWDVWFLVLAVPPFFALAFDALASLSAARAGSATRYLAAVLAITAVLVAAQQALFLGSTRPAMVASIDRGEEAALAAAWTRGFLRPTQSVEAEPRWQVSYLLGRSVDPVGRGGGGWRRHGHSRRFGTCRVQGGLPPAPGPVHRRGTSARGLCETTGSPPMNPIRVAVIGVGHLGSLHAKMLRDIPGAVLTGVYDADSERAARVAAEHGTRHFTDLGSLLSEVDAVTVATTTSSHFDVGREVLERGKHLFVEKPITETVEQADALCSLARSRGVRIQVGHIERFNPAILSLDRYEIRPLFVESHRLAQFNPRGTDVAVVLDLMIHDIDLILSFVRSPVKSVEASGVAVVSESIDIANARLQFENGCVANVTASRISQRKMRKMRMFQPNTYISIDFSEGMAEVFRLASEGEPDVEGTLMLGELGSGARRKRILYEQPEVREVNALKHELGLFVGCAAANTEPLVTGEDGRRALEVANSIMEKIRQQPVLSL